VNPHNAFRVLPLAGIHERVTEVTAPARPRGAAAKNLKRYWLGIKKPELKYSPDDSLRILQADPLADAQRTRWRGGGPAGSTAVSQAGHVMSEKPHHAS
jgi:hypothetical protein